MDISLASFVVKSADGSINMEETLVKFQDTVLAWQEQAAQAAEEVSALVHQVFDSEKPGKRLSTDWILFQVQKASNLDAEGFKVLSKRVVEFLKNSPEFHTQRGKGGGVARVADLV